MGSRPVRAYLCRIPQDVWPNHIVVQFQNEKYVQLHQDSYPGDKSAFRTAPPKDRRVFETWIAQALIPAKRRHPLRQGCKEPD